jgi:hypothetical protein
MFWMQSRLKILYTIHATKKHLNVCLIGKQSNGETAAFTIKEIA